MNDPALDIENDPVTMDGLEDVFAEESQSEESRTVQDSIKTPPRLVEDRPLVHPISVDEAARLLRISTNAVCKRLRKGSLAGRKVPGKFKDEWLVEGAGLLNVVEIDFGKGEDGPNDNKDGTGSVQDRAMDGPGSVQDSGSTEQSFLRLLELVETQGAKLEAASGQIGYLQAQLEAQTRLLESKESEIKLLVDSQKKTSTWTRFWLWFTGQS